VEAAAAPSEAAPAAPNDAAAATPSKPVYFNEMFDGVRDIDYIAVLGNYVRQDVHRVPAGPHYGGGASLIFGRHFGSGWGWEANYTLSALETGPTGGGDLYIHNFGGDLTYSLGNRQSFTPFLLLGGGGVFDDVHPRRNGGISGYVDGGLGFTTGTFWHHRIRLRGELRAIHDFTENAAGDKDKFALTDYRAGLGIEIPFYEYKPAAVQPPPPPPPQVVEVIKEVKVPVQTGLLDDDGDGVINDKDKCPNTPANTRVDGDGCTLPKVLRLDGVTFEFNKSRLRPDSQTILNSVTEIMKRYPDLQVELAGYTDSVGGAAYNLRLSQARAEAVKAYLTETGGIEAGRIKAKGYGKENPVADNATDEGRERNRRVELHTLN
jgi:OOP family OmpA-OmpF porin